MATTLDPAAADESDSVIVWCGGTVIPVSLPAGSCPASVRMLTSTLAASESTFIRSSWICLTPFCGPGPANHRSDPGSPQRMLARPELLASSASMACAMVPLAVTDQPWTTWVGFLLTLCAAGTFSIHSAPGSAGLIGLTGFSWAPASGTGASAAWPGCPAGPEAVGPAMKATWPEPPP